MTAPTRKDIFDADRLLAQIESQTGHKSNANSTKVVLTILKSHYEEARQHIRARFEENNRPATYLKEMTAIVDTLIQVIFELVQPATGETKDETKPAISLIAVGGYGRSELFPHSDIDLLFVYDPKARGLAEKIAENFLYYLWDMGFQVGHALRSPAEAIALAKEDHTVAANLLDMRFLQGDRSLFSRLEKDYCEQVRGQNVRSFVEAKLAERDERHRKHGDSRFLLEPNIKENKGALRDLHLLYWLSHFCYGTRKISALVKQGLLTEQEHRDFRKAEQFLWSVRVHLHLLSGRAEECLTFDMQKQIGERLGYRTHHQHRPVERFMKRYFQVAKIIGDLTRIFCAILEEEQTHLPRLSLSRLLEREKHIDGFSLRGQRLNFVSPRDLYDNPVMILQLFHSAQAHHLDIHPLALQLVSRNLSLIDHELRANEQANRLFLEMLLSDKGPEITMRRLNEAGVLGKFIPDFGRVVGQMQYDMYHIYTVDEHTIRALGILHAIETGAMRDEVPLATEVIRHISSRAVLYLALLCHDIAKGRGGNHAILGEKIVRMLAARFGLSPHEAETAGWLVREHILCTEIAFKRDLDDPRTIADFVAKVQSPERLRLLLVLSVADVRAVGPSIWNRWKGALMRKLYYRAEELMGSADFTKRHTEIDRFTDQMTQALTGWSEEDIARYFEAGFPEFWLSFTIKEHVGLAHMVRAVAHGEKLADYQHEVDTQRGITHLRVCLPYHHALFAHIAGSVTLIGATIISAKLFDLRNGLAVALLEIQNNQETAFDDEKRLKKWQRYLVDIVEGRINMTQALAAHRTQTSMRMKALGVRPSVFIDNNISSKFTVIEVNGLDRPGFLYDVTSTLIEQRLRIGNAYITTYGEKAVDVFYVKDIFGLKITHPGKLQEIQNRLITALSDDAPRQAV